MVGHGVLLRRAFHCYKKECHETGKICISLVNNWRMYTSKQVFPTMKMPDYFSVLSLFLIGMIPEIQVQEDLCSTTPYNFLAGMASVVFFPYSSNFALHLGDCCVMAITSTTMIFTCDIVCCIFFLSSVSLRLQRRIDPYSHDFKALSRDPKRHPVFTPLHPRHKTFYIRM